MKPPLVLVAAALAALLVPTAEAAILYSTPGAAYAQNFDSLPMKGMKFVAESKLAVRPSGEIWIRAATSNRRMFRAGPGSSSDFPAAGCDSTRRIFTTSPEGVATALPSSHEGVRLLSHPGWLTTWRHRARPVRWRRRHPV